MYLLKNPSPNQNMILRATYPQHNLMLPPYIIYPKFPPDASSVKQHHVRPESSEGKHVRSTGRHPERPAGNRAAPTRAREAHAPGSAAPASGEGGVEKSDILGATFYRANGRAFLLDFFGYQLNKI